MLLLELHKDNFHFQSRPCTTQRDHTVSQAMGILDTWGGVFRDPNSYWRTQFKFKLVRVSYLRDTPFLACFLHAIWDTSLTFPWSWSSRHILKPKSVEGRGQRDSTVPLPPYLPEDLGRRPCPFPKGTTMRVIQGIFYCSDQTKITILFVS